MKLEPALTHRFLEEQRRSAGQTGDDFTRQRYRARFLGAHPTDTGVARFGFWTPEIAEESIDESAVVLELYTPARGTCIPDEIDPTVAVQEIPMRRVTVPTVRDGEFTWAVVSGVTAGTRDTFGTLYRLRFVDAAGQTRWVYDPLAYSVPFGAGAPAELYDIAGMFARRRDSAHFAARRTVPDSDGVPRVAAPVHLLEVHTPTATAAGTLAGLTREINRIAATVADGTPRHALAPSDQALVDYEAIQLMPVEPTILHESGPSFWTEPPGDADEIAVTVRRPDTTNWGYDVITVASPAPNPTLLESGRPDELLDLVEALHSFPDHPIHLVFDIVYGHADNQALTLLNRHFFAGANMYGQNLNYRHPVVRSILLEMQRRKSNYGVDGVRVDGAQDFTYWVSEENALYHDNEYLRLMNDLEQEAAGVRYRPWMIFEDGRPWPRDDWELASTYREVTRIMPRVVQWGPLTFAHNTPFLFTFWIGKWWRIREIMESGAHWITGNSNHDTLRRGTQVAPDALMNSFLGRTMPEIFENGYDNAGARLFDACMPGIPMDFLNANLRGPWSFMRNTDAKWALKVVSEETWFPDWNVRPEQFVQPWAFPRLKQLGFRSLGGLKQFIRALDAAVRTGEYTPEAIALHLNSVRPRIEGPRQFSGTDLAQIARAWMDDVHDFCNLDHHRQRTNSDTELARRRHFARSVRELRHQERWLAGNCTDGDRIDYLHPANGTVLVTGHRRRPEVVASSDGPQPLADFAPQSRWAALVFIINLEGAPRTVVPRELIGGDQVWTPLRITPQLARTLPESFTAPSAGSGQPDATTVFDQPVTLTNSQGILFGANRH